MVLKEWILNSEYSNAQEQYKHLPKNNLSPYDIFVCMILGLIKLVEILWNMYKWSQNLFLPHISMI